MTLRTTPDRISGKRGAEVQGSNPEFTGILLLFFLVFIYLASIKGSLQVHAS